MRLQRGDDLSSRHVIRCGRKGGLRERLWPHHRRRNPALSASIGIFSRMPTSTPTRRIPIINTRSFGEDPQQVGDLVAAYIRGARASGMMTTAKHFPGHGDTATDSHLSVAQVTGDRARLDSVELAPFRKAIEAGVDSVMVAHVSGSRA